MPYTPLVFKKAGQPDRVANTLTEELTLRWNGWRLDGPAPEPDDVVRESNLAAAVEPLLEAERATASATFQAKVPINGGRWLSAAVVNGPDQSALINTEMAELSALGGGELVLPPTPGTSTINIGAAAVALNIPAHVRLVGAGSRYRGNNNPVKGGTTLAYSGSGTAVKATSVTNIGVRGITIRATAPTGAVMRGLWLNGVWYGEVEDIAVEGILPAHGYSILSDVNGTFGSYVNKIRHFDCGVGVNGGVIRVAGSGSGSGAEKFVMMTVIERGWAARYEYKDSQTTVIAACAEGWQQTIEDNDVGGHTIDGYGTVVLIACPMEGDENVPTGKTRPAIYVKPTYVGKGVYEYGSNWEGHSGVRFVGNPFPSDVSGVAHMNATTEYSQSPLTAGTRIKGPRWGQQRPGGVSDFAKIETVAENVTGGAQSGYLVESRRIGGSLRDSNDHGLRWTVRNAKSVPNDGTAVTFFTIPFGQYGFGGNITAFVLGVQPGVGQVATSRKALIGTGPAQAGVGVVEETKVYTGANAVDVLFTVSGNDLLVQVTMLAGSGAATLTVALDVFGILRSGVIPA